MEEKTKLIIKQCNSFEEFCELIEDVKQLHMKIFYNGLIQDKRQELTTDFDDIFDNNVLVRYTLTKDELNVWIGDGKFDVWEDEYYK